MRVSVRRMRAALKAARPLLDAVWADGLRAELGLARPRAGPGARPRRAAPAAARGDRRSCRTGSRPPATILVAMLEARERPHARTMLAALDAPRYTALLERLADAVRLPLPDRRRPRRRSPSWSTSSAGRCASCARPSSGPARTRRTRCCTRCGSTASGCATPASCVEPALRGRRRRRHAEALRRRSRHGGPAGGPRRPPGRLRGRAPDPRAASTSSATGRTRRSCSWPVGWWSASGAGPTRRAPCGGPRGKRVRASAWRLRVAPSLRAAGRRSARSRTPGGHPRRAARRSRPGSRRSRRSARPSAAARARPRGEPTPSASPLVAALAAPCAVRQAITARPSGNPAPTPTPISTTHSHGPTTGGIGSTSAPTVPTSAHPSATARPEPPAPPPLGQRRDEQRGRDLGDAPHREQQPAASAAPALALVVRREPGEPAVEQHRRRRTCSRPPAGRRGPARAAAAWPRVRPARPVGPAGDRRPDRRPPAPPAPPRPRARTTSRRARRPAARRPRWSPSRRSSWTPRSRRSTAPARSARCSLTTPVISTPATPMPRPTSRLPPISAGSAGTPRTRLPSRDQRDRAPRARAPGRSASPTAGPTNEPTAIISTAPACTSPAAPAEIPSSSRTVSSSGG